MKKGKIIKFICYSFVLILVFISSCAKEKGEKIIDCSGATPSYVSDIKPIINANCLSSGCHNAGSNHGDFTAYDGLKRVASSGSLERKVVVEKTMPVSSELSFEERKKIKCWINSGAPNN